MKRKIIGLLSVAMTACILAFNNMVVMAQEVQPPHPSTQVPKQESWDAFKQEMKTKQTTLTSDIEKLRAEMQTKKVDAPGLKSALSRYDAEQKAFGDLMATIDQVTPEKRDQFKVDLNNQYNKLKTAHSQVKTEWEKALNPEDKSEK